MWLKLRETLVTGCKLRAEMYVEDQIRQSLLNDLVKWAGNLEFMLRCGGSIEIGARVDNR